MMAGVWTADGFTHEYEDVNGVRLHYVVGGRGDPVVLLHGWPLTWYEWRHIMPDLAKQYTVIAPDLRGLGESSVPEQGYDGKTVAEDIHLLGYRGPGNAGPLPCSVQRPVSWIATTGRVRDLTNASVYCLTNGPAC